ncbi:hypothetical protein D3C81_1599570 [compost metagenome]
MPEILREALATTQTEEFANFGTELLEQLAAVPWWVLEIACCRDREHRDTAFGQPCPPVLLAIAEAAKQPMPA